jgi:hypothetical protein
VSQKPDRADRSRLATSDRRLAMEVREVARTLCLQQAHRP